MSEEQPTGSSGSGIDAAADDRRSWPFVLLGAGVALIIGIVIWVFWLAPGEPTVDPLAVAPSITTSERPTATATTSPTPAPTTTASTPIRTASPSPTTRPGDEVNNPIDDAIVGYPGTPLKRTTSTVPVDNVKVVQQRLVDLGFVVAVDGVFGARTETAVKTFQRDEGLKADGIVGRQTWAALFTSDGG